MKYTLVVDRRRIVANHRYGEKRPPISVFEGQEFLGYTNLVDIVSPCQVVYDPEEPHFVGATTWIETDSRPVFVNYERELDPKEG